MREGQENIETTIAVISSNLEYIKRDIATIKEQIKSDFVTREEFAPVKALVFGMVGLILTGVVAALLSLTLRN